MDQTSRPNKPPIVCKSLWFLAPRITARIQHALQRVGFRDGVSTLSRIYIYKYRKEAINTVLIKSSRKKRHKPPRTLASTNTKPKITWQACPARNSFTYVNFFNDKRDKLSWLYPNRHHSKYYSRNLLVPHLLHKQRNGP